MEAPAKTLSPVAIIAAAFNIWQSWVAIGATFALSVGHGGNATVIYGLILIFIVYGAIALTTAELVAQYPTAGGQYHWSAILAPPRIRREVVSDTGTRNTNYRALKQDIELYLRMHQYHWLGNVDGQCAHYTTTDHRGSD